MFALQNPDVVTLHFLTWHLQTSVAVLTLAATTVGAMIAGLVGLAARLQRWQRTRAAERRRGAARRPPPHAIGLAVEVEESAHLVEALRDRLDAQDVEGLRERAERTHPADLAAALRELPLDDRVAVFRQLTRETAGAVLSELDDETLLALVGPSSRRKSPGSSIGCRPTRRPTSSRRCPRTRPSRSSRA